MKKSNQRQNDKPMSAPLDDKVSRRIKAIRIEKRISQTDVAEKIGMERSNYNRMENRGEKLSVDLLEKIADALDVSIIQLISDNADDMPPTTLDVDRLKKRSEELEDRLHDKQQIIDAYEVHSQTIKRQLYNEIWGVAIELELVTWPTNLAVHRSFLDTWGEDRENEKGERVLVFGDKYASLTATDLNRIYEYMEEKNSIFFRLFQTVASEIYTSPNSFIRRTLYARLLKALPPEQLDRLKSSDGGDALTDLINNP